MRRPRSHLPGPLLIQTALRVPYVDLAAQHSAIREELLVAVGAVLDSGAFILGDEVSEFEERFAALCGARYAIGVASGTDALVLALRILGIGPGDEVITAPNSFVASATAIVLVGARPVFADVGDDYNLDPKCLQQAITPRTKAIVPVHLTGRAARMTEICTIASRHGLEIVEDCAQAILAEHRGRKVGTFGRISAFSLHPLKTLGACGDGGMVVTDDESLRDRTVVLRNIGLRTRDDCVAWSQNSRLDTLQAAILLVKLRYLERWTQARREAARRYREGLGDCPGIRLPGEGADEIAVYHTFVIEADERDALRAFLADRGIGSQIHYPVPIHLCEAARGLGYKAGAFPTAERQAMRILSLPVHHTLTLEQQAHVIASIRDFYS